MTNTKPAAFTASHFAAVRELDARTDALLTETREELDAAEHAAAEFGAGPFMVEHIAHLRDRIANLTAKAAGSYGAA